jgi:hypothetical protein
MLHEGFECFWQDLKLGPNLLDDHYNGFRVTIKDVGSSPWHMLQPVQNFLNFDFSQKPND